MVTSENGKWQVAFWTMTGVLFILCLGSYGYTFNVENKTNSMIERNRNNVELKLDQIINKLSTLCERLAVIESHKP